MPFVFVTAALGLALYYLRTRHPPPSSAPNLSLDQQPRQAPHQDHKLNAMDPKERAYHERFMREAIGMVNMLASLYLNDTLLTHHPIRPSSL